MKTTGPESRDGTAGAYSGRRGPRPARDRSLHWRGRIYDYVDREVPAHLRMFEKRPRTYRAIGYARGEAPLGFAEPARELTVEYDDEALRRFKEADR